MEVVLKEGDPECVADIRRNTFKLRMLENLSYREGSERAVGIREKARLVNSLLNDPEELEDERERHKKLRSSSVGVKK